MENSNYLTSQVIFLKRIRGKTDTIMGHHIHGFLFSEILKSQAPDLADYLHHSNTSKPFSLSYLSSHENMYWFRIVSWDENITRAVFAYFTTCFKIKLDQAIFELVKTATRPEEFQWAHRLTFEEFFESIDYDNKKVLQIDHYSPTSFKRGDSHLSLPVPELVVHSVYRSLPDEIRETIDISPDILSQFLLLKDHKIVSVYNQKNHGSIASFMGSTYWQIHKKAEPQCREALLKLLHFAFFSGIGVKTTQGMGMCRVRDAGK